MISGFSLFDVLTLRPFFHDENMARMVRYRMESFRLPLELRPPIHPKDENGNDFDLEAWIKTLRRGEIAKARVTFGGGLVYSSSVLTTFQGRPMVAAFGTEIPTEGDLVAPIAAIPAEVRLPVFDSMERFEKDFLRASDGWLRLVKALRKIGPDPRLDEEEV